MSQRPNVIWFFGDQHRAQSLSCMGDPNLSTPNLDRMAIEGVHFPGAIANNPWCCPFRFTCITGKHSHRGVYRTPMPMDPSERTVAHHLGEAGYRTHYIGKWHLAGSNSGVGVPRERRGGFDSWIGYENNNSQYDCWVHGHDDQGTEIDEYRLPTYETDALTDLLIERIRGEAGRQRAGDDQPFFATCSVQPPHGPNVAPTDDMARHRPGGIELRKNVPPVPWVEDEARRRLAGYHAQIENLDANIGRVMAALAEEGLLDNTYIMVFADHGDCMGSHGYFEKSSPWEESIRIPFFIGGGVPYRGSGWGRRDAPLPSAVDILPTTLGLCGVDLPEGIDGFNYAPYRTDPKQGDPLPEEPDSVYIQHLVRKLHKDSPDRPWRGVVTRDGWKYVCLDGAPWLMFNLNDDPYETCNLAFNRRFFPQRERLHQRLERWMRETGDDQHDFALPEL
jgi:arylsulfatase A-like enzyme